MSTTFSVVINTYNRVASLRKTIQGLRGLDATGVEVVVVNGPSTDSTADYLATLEDVVVRDCPAANLSWSRNIGIRAARGDVVAFIDDDAYPDPSWLDDLARAFEDPEVGGAGGPVWDYTGGRLQLRYSVVNRFGDARILYDCNPTLVSNHPRSEWFAHTIGTNSAFRRSAITSIGGFDEEFEYYLDETDVCCRLVSAGWVVAELENGFVYHKFLPSDVRGNDRVIRNRWPILKNRCYFALKHGAAWSSFADAAASVTAFVNSQRAEIAHHVGTGALTAAEAAAFEEDVHTGSNRALEQYVAGADRSRPPAWFDEDDDRAFLPFATSGATPGRMHVVYFAADYPPNVVYGISRVVHSLATGMAARGHVVRVMVLSPTEPHPRVDLEDGVWVHRLPWIDSGPLAPPDVPERIWRSSWILHAELTRMDAHRRVDVVQTPNWDSLGVATQRSSFDGRTVIGLYTPLGVAAGMNVAIDPDNPEIKQMIALEKAHYGRADGLLACGPAVVSEIESVYDAELQRHKVGYVPHGLVDAAAGVPPSPSQRRLLYVGRLELRKGVDVLLDVLAALVSRVPGVQVDVVGDDPDGLGAAWREGAGAELQSAVHFHGQVSDASLHDHYRDCGVLVIPSRFESFGLPIVEAAMWGRPSVASEVGGMVELVEDGVTGRLVPVADHAALLDALVDLLLDDGQRDEMGRRARQRFLEQHERDRMAASAERFYASLL